MQQLIKVTDAIWLLQLAISTPLIHALGDRSQAPNRIWTRVPRLRGGLLTNWAIPSPWFSLYVGFVWLSNIYCLCTYTVALCSNYLIVRGCKVCLFIVCEINIQRSTLQHRNNYFGLHLNLEVVDLLMLSIYCHNKVYLQNQQITSYCYFRHRKASFTILCWFTNMCQPFGWNFREESLQYCSQSSNTPSVINTPYCNVSR